MESLSKFTALINPSLPRAAVAFGENEKALAATQTFFAIANRCRLSTDKRHPQLC